MEPGGPAPPGGPVDPFGPRLPSGPGGPGIPWERKEGGMDVWGGRGREEGNELEREVGGREVKKGGRRGRVGCEGGREEGK